jgi:nitrogen fixation/metabolism regulation signal transduction histidine kinase
MLNPQQPFIETIFACLYDGVITIDASNAITFCNATASSLLNLGATTIVGQHYQKAFSSVPQLGLIGRLHALRMQQTSSVVRASIEGEIPGRGHVHLNLSLGLVMDTYLNYLGIVMILDNTMEKPSTR